MIEKIYVDNCLSFKNPTLISIGESNISCFFGGNGSGKTNLVILLRFLRRWIDVKTAKLDRSSFQFLPRFKLSSSRKLKSTIEVVLFIRNERYIYRIEFVEGGTTSETLFVDGQCVINDKLFSESGQLLEVEIQRLSTYNFNFNSIISIISSEGMMIESAYIKSKCKAFFDFMKSDIVDFEEITISEIAENLYKNSILKENVINLLQHIGTDISDIKIDKNNIDRDKYIDLILNRNVLSSQEGLELVSAFARLVNEKYRFESVTINNKKLNFNLLSDGIQRIIMIFSIVFDNKSKILIFDEIESDLHEKLTALFIKYVKKNCYQTILTTHLIDVMTFDLLSKKEVFLLSIDKDFSTIITRLTQYPGLRQDDRNSFRNLYRNDKLVGYPAYSVDYEQKI